VWLNSNHPLINTRFALSAKHSYSSTADTTIISRFNAFLNMRPSDFGKCSIFTSPGCNKSGKIFAFDMDGTLITPIDKKAKFCSSSSDWRWFSPNVVSVLQSIHNAGYKIVVFTNQGGISKNHTTLEIVQKRCEAMITEANVPMQIFIAFDSDFYRKPATGMFWLLSTKLNNGIPIDINQSMYVGDAAGRPKVGKQPKDHSSTDLAFALNCGLAFEVPEDLFNKTTEYNSWTKTATLSFITPKRLPPPLHNEAAVRKYRKMLRPTNNKEIVLIVGLPGAGKSTLTSIAFPDYVRINQDLLKTRSKCISAANAAISSGSSIIIDATNIKEEIRDQWVVFANMNKLPLRIIVLPFDRDISFHFDNVRSINPLGGVDGISDKRHVPPMIIYSMAKSYEPPEGDNVMHIVPAPGPFTSPELLKLNLPEINPIDVITFSDFWKSLTYAVYT
jgi:bifunctional polynucleotide phosphatase/kinase